MGGLPACKGNDPPERTEAGGASHAELCAGAARLEPPRGALHHAIGAFERGDYAAARSRFDELARKYPGSPGLQVWRGDVALYDKAIPYAESARRALPFYDKADALQRAGCPVRERDAYYLRMGRAYAELRLDRPERAREQLELARARWPDSPEVHYHLARAYCLAGQVEACADSFQKTLELAAALKRPKFLRTHHAVDDWIERSKSQSELPPLRRSPRYARIVAEARRR